MAYVWRGEYVVARVSTVSARVKSALVACAILWLRGGGFQPRHARAPREMAGRTGGLPIFASNIRQHRFPGERSPASAALISLSFLSPLFGFFFFFFFCCFFFFFFSFFFFFFFFFFFIVERDEGWRLEGRRIVLGIGGWADGVDRDRHQHGRLHLHEGTPEFAGAGTRPQPDWRRHQQTFDLHEKP